MNLKTTFKILSRIFLAVAALMAIPLVLALVYGENESAKAFALTMGILLLLGLPPLFVKGEYQPLRARGGFIIVALSWILMSVFGALPFWLSGAIPNFLDCLFETVSGFTTTGATILSVIEGLPKSILFWRSFTHWIGGMGVLVFVVAVLPKSDPSALHLLKAEVPGPQFGKLVSKLRFTARILYAIYIALTLLETTLLLCGGLSVYDSFIHTFSTAGTGGFSTYNNSVAAFDSIYVEVVITIFMTVFSANFNLFYLLLIGQVREVIRSEELRCMLAVLAGSILLVTINLTVQGVYDSFWQSLRYASFQTASCMSTTGFTTADFDKWPALSQTILILLMFLGGSAGSTAGGVKVSRAIIGVKNGIASVMRTVSPRTVLTIKLDKRPLSQEFCANVNSYFVTYSCVFIVSWLLVSAFEPMQYDFQTNLSAIVACLNNVGPGLGLVGPTGNFGGYSALAKTVLSFDMLIGRLEIMPMLILFSPKAWKK